MTENEAIFILDVMIRLSGFEHADNVNEALEMAKTALEEIRKYRTLGTMEELREAMEKQVPKRPTNEFHKKYTRHMGDCPNCKSGISSRKLYCPYCGQKIDWNDEE